MQKILCVDDEPNIRNILDFTLGVEGYRVLTASDGEQALALAALEAPDLVILDVMMPHGDGFETCRRLKADTRTKHIPIVLLTAKNSRADRERGRQVQADDYITKPFSPQRLLNTIQSLLGVPKG